MKRNKAEHQTPKLPCEGAFPEGAGHRFQGPTPPGAQRARRTAVSVQDLSHRQIPQSTLPVEVAHRCRCTTSTHPSGTRATPLPPPATGAYISSWLTYLYLPPHKKRNTALVRASLARAGTGKTYTRWRSIGMSTDLTTITFPISDSRQHDHTPSLLRTRARRASQF
ncbi:hypothetical protein AAFF_G00083780 [Aldrovandia affinis]|uniref:Uncharacterized protein n=1 Tax=Aldrovandia affinis TaxID=143900 RepID=A0AAD7RX38_9TELE|nr:hypothetical protein AAFF_G00083780 [Aldrovandia affinis]